MTSNLPSKSRRRGASVCGLGGLALASVLLLCGAGNVPIENFTPQGPMQADLNVGGHNVTNAATINATNVAAATLTATAATAGTLNATNATVGALSASTATTGTLNATNVAVSGSLTAPNFTLPFASVTAAPTTLAGYGITNAYTESASDARYSPLAGSTNVTTVGAITAGSFPYANLAGNPVTLASGKTLAVNNTLTLAGTDGSTLNVGTGGALGSAAFAATSAFLAPSAIGATVQAYNANTTTLGNAVNGANELVQTDGNGLLVDAVQRPSARMIYVSQGMGSNTRTGLSKYSLHTPFATLTAAAAAAVAGDTIVAEDGVFTDKNIVLVSGVDWLFLPNASVVVTNGANGDVIFEDNGTAVTTLITGCGQTFSISSTTTLATVSVLTVSGASNVSVQNLSFAVFENGSFGTGSAISSANASAVINLTGNLIASSTGTGIALGVIISAAGGGTITIDGNVTATATGGNGSAVDFTNAASSSGNVTVTGCISSNLAGIVGSTVSSVTCGSLSDGTKASTVYNRLTLLGPVVQVQVMSGGTSGFSLIDTLGPEDQLVELELTTTLAAGTVSLPSDQESRMGERVTITSTQTITTLSVSVSGSGGVIYGYSPASVGPGSITFEKIASNTWVKL